MWTYFAQAYLKYDYFLNRAIVLIKIPKCTTESLEMKNIQTISSRLDQST